MCYQGVPGIPGVPGIKGPYGILPFDKLLHKIQKNRTKTIFIICSYYSIKECEQIHEMFKNNTSINVCQISYYRTNNKTRKLFNNMFMKNVRAICTRNKHNIKLKQMMLQDL
jgi:GMP synthase PP-ATPase subunit